VFDVGKTQENKEHSTNSSPGLF